jgi:hypothetical protein
MGWIQLARYRASWHAFVKEVMNVRLLQKAGNENYCEDAL